MKARMENIRVTEEYKGITVDCNGNRRILSLHISPERFNDKQRLEEDLCTAVNQALASAEKASLGDLAGMAGDLGGLASLLGK